MLKRLQRLRKSRDIGRVYRFGKICRGRWFSCRALTSPQGVSRVTVVVSTKVSKSAVRRNRMRRRLQAIFKELSPDFSGQYDLIISLHQDCLEATPTELRQALVSCLKSLKVLH